VGTRAGLDTEARGKILCPRRGSNPEASKLVFGDERNNGHISTQIRVQESVGYNTISSKEHKVVPQHTYKGAGGEEM
jgi:hypothetical protein